MSYRHSKAASAFELVTQAEYPRDSRIDFLRGLCLMFVLIDHIDLINQRSSLSLFTLKPHGFSDAAEGFVFLAGLSYGYRQANKTKETLVVLRMAFRRAFIIYSAYISSLLITCLFCPVLTLVHSQFWIDSIERYSFAKHLVFTIVLLDQPLGFAILPFYVIALPILAMTFMSLKRSPALTLAIATFFYSSVQLFPSLNLRNILPANGVWYFNPFAWQILLVLGAAFGSRKIAFTAHAPSKFLIAALATTILISSCLLKHGLIPSPKATFWTSFGDKVNLGPLRLIHFMALIIVVNSLSCKLMPYISSSSLFRTIELMGRHSLPLYTLGLVLTYLSVFCLSVFGSTTAILLMLHFDAVLLSYLLARQLDARYLIKRQPQQPAK